MPMPQMETMEAMEAMPTKDWRNEGAGTTPDLQFPWKLEKKRQHRQQGGRQSGIATEKKLETIFRMMTTMVQKMDGRAWQSGLLKLWETQSYFLSSLFFRHFFILFFHTLLTGV